MAKKKVLRILRSFADRMPENFIQTATKSPIYGWELVLCGHKQVEGKDIEPGKVYFVDVPTFVAQNNYKDLKKTLVSSGANGVLKRVNG